MAHHHEEKSSLHNNNNNKIMVSSSTSSTFCYSEISPNNNHHPNTQFHNNNNNNFDHQNPEIYHLANGLEMIGFQPKQLNNDDHHASKSSNFMQQQQHQQHHNNLHQIGGNNFLDETTLRTSSCVFPCEGNERPSQGLSLSLSSSNPSSIGVQSFELRNNNNHLLNHHHHHNNNQRFNPSQSSFQQQEFFLGKSASNSNNNSTTTTSGLSMMSLSSKYMGPTQELLNEFCNLGTQQKQQSMKNNKKKKNKDNNWELLSHDHHNITNDNDLENNATSSSSSRNNNMIATSLYGLSILDLQKRKTKLFGMLEELDRRYKHYCDQMKGIESSFESAAGVGTANVYTTVASKAMSKHFRCLRDSLVAQIKATKKAMGEKDASPNSTIPGTSKGETPRLRILDQTLRQQRAFQQMSMMEAHPWRPQRGLPERSVSVLRAWLFEHFLHPYPSDVDKHILARQTGLSRSQVSNWFINARVRLWKPMVEQMYQEESKEQQDNMGSSSDNATDHQPTSDHDGLIQDQKPNPEDLVRLDPDSLSSIVNTTNPTTNSIINNNVLNTNNNLQQSQTFGRAEAFGYVALADFPSSSSYNDNNAPQQGFGGSTSRGNNVSLTLGLQQHGGNGVSLAFSPASQGTLFHDYSLLDGDQGQNLPYRNLMDAQLLHDFAQ